MRHSKADALAVIRQLALLGEALGYETCEEHRVGRSAAVDLSWTAADSNDVPLFVFEVETTVSTSLANNASKVFGSPVDELPKPLFFFHVVLAGSPDNERIRNARAVWGQHNYRVYRWNAPGQAVELVRDVLRQHRRISRFVEPGLLAAALLQPPWDAPESVRATLQLSETLRFDGPFLGDYALVARRRPEHLRLFAERVGLLSELAPVSEFDDGYSFLSREGYPGLPGSYIPGLLETALRVAAGDLSDRDGPAAFESWATSCGHGRRMIEPSFGLARDYDAFILGTAPVQYAACAALLRDHPASWGWLLADWAKLLQSKRWERLHPRSRLPGALWMAHVIAATAPAQPLHSTAALSETYPALAAYVRDNAQRIPPSVLVHPPGPFDPTDHLPQWVTEAGVDDLPTPVELQAQMTHLLGPAAWGDNLVQEGVPGGPGGRPGADDGGPDTAQDACLDALTSWEFWADPARRLLPLLYSSPNH